MSKEKLKRLIAINASSAIIQIAIRAVTLLLLYRFLLASIGISMVGIWSLVMATASMVRLGNLGMSGSLVKYAAKYDALKDIGSISSAVETAVISSGLSTLIVLIIAYPAAKLYLKIVLKPEQFQLAIEVVPYAMIGFWIFLVTGVYQACLYGCHSIAQQNAVLIADSIIYLLLCYLTVPAYGLLGVALCRLCVNCLTLAVTLILLKKRIPLLAIVPRRWDKGMFREMIGYALNFQAILLLEVLCDPVTKGLLSKFGSISMVGYYEMAGKVVQQLHLLFAKAYQVLVPAFANLKEIEPHMISAAYIDSYRFLFYIALPAYCISVIAMPLVSVAWIGSYQPMFVWSAVILTGGWFFNTLGTPAYHAYLGIGDMRWNVISQFVMSICNLIFGFLFAMLWGGLGVAAAWALSLSLGGMIQSISYNLKSHIALREIFPASSRPLTMFSLLGLAIAYAVHQMTLPSCSGSLGNGVMISCFTLTISVPLWVHPLRKKVAKWVGITVEK